MDKEHLKELGKIKLSEIDKERNFQKIEQRLEKQSMFNWKIPSLLIAIAAIALFLVLTEPWSPKQTVATEGPQIKEALITMGDFIPTSSWQRGVKKEKDTEVLAEYTELLEVLTLVEPIETKSTPYFTVKLIYEDGSNRVLQQYYLKEQPHFYERGSNRYYQLSHADAARFDSKLIDSYYDNDISLWWLVAIFGVVGMVRYVNKKMSVQGESDRKLPRHSTYWQSIVSIGMVLIVGPILVFVPHVHFMILVGLIVLGYVVCILLEMKYGNNNWRKFSFVTECCQILLTIYLILYVIG